ncbi:hypothetical protein [Clostridium guangxiense]|nr:hypothetical protein [Clostridium guangxiense]
MDNDYKLPKLDDNSKENIDLLEKQLEEEYQRQLKNDKNKKENQ